MTPRFACTFIGLLGLSLLLGCSPGGIASELRPKAETAATVFGTQTMMAMEGDGEPLIVDWKPEQRGDLEVAMKEGVAIVSVNGKGLRLLKNCRLDGTYGFLGMNTKESLIRLENGDEVRANLPLAGIGLAAKLEGELQRGSTIDIAMMMVGKLRSTWNSAAKEDLMGSCTEATHYVRGATVGAFAMETGTKAKVRAAAELFGAGAGTQSASNKDVTNKDGDLAACKKASPDATQPPSQCGALIRLELTALSQHGGAKAPKEKVVTAVRPTCPQPLVLLEGKCTAASANKPYLCKQGDIKECTQQCDRGSAESCSELGFIYLFGEGVAEDHARSTSLFEKACGGGDLFSCVQWGLNLMERQPADFAKVIDLLEQGCRGGIPEGCAELGTMALHGLGMPRDPTKAAGLLQQACNGGDDDACSELGGMYLIGLSVAKDVPRAASIFKRACDGDSPNACANLAFLHESGTGVAKDPARALALYTRACEADPASCSFLGMLHESGTGVPQDAAKAIALYKQSCGAGDVFACALLGVVHGEKVTIPPEAAKPYIDFWTDACKADSGRDCSALGIMQLATGAAVQGLASVKKGCQLKDPWACVVQKKLGVGK